MSVVNMSVVSVVIPEYEDIDKKWFTYSLPQYKYFISCMEFGKAKTHELFVFRNKDGIKFYCMFDYLFGFDPINKLKTYDVENIEVILFDKKDKFIFYPLSPDEKENIECIILQYVNQYYK
jgi:hypothetical protein